MGTLYGYTSASTHEVLPRRILFFLDTLLDVQGFDHQLAPVTANYLVLRLPTSQRCASVS